MNLGANLAAVGQANERENGAAKFDAKGARGEIRRSGLCRLGCR